MIETPFKLSPIHAIAQSARADFVDIEGWQVPHVYTSVPEEIAAAQHRVTICDMTHLVRITVEGQLAGAVLSTIWPSYEVSEIGVGVEVAAGLSIFQLRRDRFLISAPNGQGEDIVAALEAAATTASELTTITDVTNGWAELWLIGPESAELLSLLCGLDFHVSQFPNLMAKQSSVAKTNQTIIHHNVGDTPAYALLGGRSLATYLWETVMEAGRQFQIRPVGLATVRKLAE